MRTPQQLCTTHLGARETTVGCCRRRSESIGGWQVWRRPVQHVVMAPQPGASFVVLQPELPFELLVVELDLPQSCQACGWFALGVGGQVREPVADRLLVAF